MPRLQKSTVDTRVRTHTVVQKRINISCGGRWVGGGCRRPPAIRPRSPLGRQVPGRSFLKGDCFRSPRAEPRTLRSGSRSRAREVGRRSWGETTSKAGGPRGWSSLATCSGNLPEAENCAWGDGPSESEGAPKAQCGDAESLHAFWRAEPATDSATDPGRGPILPHSKDWMGLGLVSSGRAPFKPRLATGHLLV
jgi:hypothetical protein